ncbi:MAG: hypothetical protein R2828_00895 [Saprospiraceae bacterium]
MNEDKELKDQETDVPSKSTFDDNENDLSSSNSQETGGENIDENEQKRPTGSEKDAKGKKNEENRDNQDNNNSEGQTNINNANKIDNNYYNFAVLDKEHVKQLYQALSGGSEEGYSNRFSLNMLELIEQGELANLSSKCSFIAPQELYQQGVSILQEYRVLIFVGGKKMGVSDIALWVSNKMNRQGEIKTIYLSEAMGTQVRINLNKDIIENKDTFQNSLVVFEEAVKKNNKDLTTFLKKVASSKNIISSSLRSNLQSTNSFLIFTLDQVELTRFPGLAEKALCINVPPVLEQKKWEYLAFKLRSLQQNDALKESQRELLENLAQNHISSIVEQLPDINDLDRFVLRVEEQLLHSKDELPDIKDLLRIIQSIKNIKNWLVEDLGKDLQSWHFIFCASLLHSFPNESEQSVSLMEFEFFRDKLEGFLKDKSKIKEERQEWVGLFPETQLLRQCRVEKRKDKVTGQQCIVFEQAEYIKDIWQIFLSNLSLNLTQIIPFLHQLITEDKLTYAAGRILGRLGEIDPLQTLQWMHHWANSHEIKDRVLVSYAMQGIMASDNLEYRTICESFISKLGHSNNFNQVWTAVVAYMEIGRCKLQFAIDELAEITDRTLSSSYELFRKLRAEKSWVSSKVERHELYNEFSFDDFKDYILSSIEKNLYDRIIEEKAKHLQQNQKIFLTISYSITTLCKMLDPISVLQTCRSWFKKEKRSIRILLIKMLLPKDGILDQLDWKISIFKQDTKKMEEWHFMVRAISLGEEAIDTIVGLFDDITAVFPSLEPGEAKAMGNLVIDHLQNWVKASVDLEEANNQIVDLFANVVFKVKYLETPLWSKINSWADPKQQKLTMKVFAAKVKQKIKALEAENMTTLSFSSLQPK